MDSSFQHNPVTRRLQKLAEKWEVFEQVSNAPLGIWKVEYDVSRMIDAFVLMEDTVQKQVSSIFLTFEADFVDNETYAFELIKEFLMNVFHPTSKASLEEAGVDVTTLRVGEIKDTHTWLKLLVDFVGLVEFLEGHFVAYLNPRHKADAQAWVDWIEKLINLELPDRLRFMIKEESQFPLFDNLIEQYPEKIELLYPEIDMGEVMHEIVDEASKKRGDVPGAKFQKLMIDVSQFVGKKKMIEAEAKAKEAIEIASLEKWDNLQIAVLIALANGYIGTKEFEMARAKFQEARRISRIYAEKEPELGKQMEVQALMGEAGTYLGEQNFKEGAPVYALAGEVASSIQKHNLEMEALRMTGFCYNYVKNYRSAWEYYRKALIAGEKLEENMRRSSTLPYVGEALLKLHSKANADIKKIDLEDKIAHLLGNDWKELIEAAKT